MAYEVFPSSKSSRAFPNLLITIILCCFTASAQINDQGQYCYLDGIEAGQKLHQSFGSFYWDPSPWTGPKMRIHDFMSRHMKAFGLPVEKRQLHSLKELVGDYLPKDATGYSGKDIRTGDLVIEIITSNPDEYKLSEALYWFVHKGITAPTSGGTAFLWGAWALSFMVDGYRDWPALPKGFAGRVYSVQEATSMFAGLRSFKVSLLKFGASGKGRVSTFPYRAKRTWWTYSKEYTFPESKYLYNRWTEVGDNKFKFRFVVRSPFVRDLVDSGSCGECLEKAYCSAEWKECMEDSSFDFLSKALGSCASFEQI